MKKLEYRNDLKSFIFENYIDLLKNNIKNCKEAEKYFSKKDYKDTKNIEGILSDMCFIDDFLGNIFDKQCRELLEKGYSYEKSLIDIIVHFGKNILGRFLFDFYEYLDLFVQVGHMDIFDGESDRDTILGDLSEEIVEDFLDSL